MFSYTYIYNSDRICIYIYSIDWSANPDHTHIHICFPQQNPLNACMCLFHDEYTELTYQLRRQSFHNKKRQIVNELPTRIIHSITFISSSIRRIIPLQRKWKPFYNNKKKIQNSKSNQLDSQTRKLDRTFTFTKCCTNT